MKSYRIIVALLIFCFVGCHNSNNSQNNDYTIIRNNNITGLEVSPFGVKLGPFSESFISTPGTNGPTVIENSNSNGLIVGHQGVKLGPASNSSVSTPKTGGTTTVVNCKNNGVMGNSETNITVKTPEQNSTEDNNLRNLINVLKH